MDISSSKILGYLTDAPVSVRTESGESFKEVSCEEMKMLVACDHVRAVVRGGKLKRVYLTVPPDVAGRSLGETRKRVKDSLHCDANETVQRSLPSLPSFHKRHHLPHCFSWPCWRNDDKQFPAQLVVQHPTDCVRFGGPLSPPLRAA